MSHPSKLEKKLLHYVGKAIADYHMIETGDKVMVCLSGGKDSYVLVKILHLLQLKTRGKFEMLSFTLNQMQPGWHDEPMRAWLRSEKIPFEILDRDTYSIVKEKVPKNKTYCLMCSRLRRGIIYRYARENGFNKVALGHHREDLNTSLLMSIFYNGAVCSMPPKLLSNTGDNIVIRPLAYCQEQDILDYAKEQGMPIIPCGLCSSQENLMREKVGRLIKELAVHNPKVPSNILSALQNVKLSQLMDKGLWDFDQFKPKAKMEVFGAEE